MGEIQLLGSFRMLGCLVLSCLVLHCADGPKVEELFEFASALNIVKDLKGSAEIDVVKRWRGECAMAVWDQVYKDWQSWTDPLKLNLAINSLSKQHQQSD
jgi:hypothetical protein